MYEETPRGFDPEFRLDEKSPPPDWNEIFGRAAPLCVEIGTGNGLWLADEAARKPDINILGFERDGEFFGKMKRRIVQSGVRNVRCIRADVKDTFPEIFAPASIDRIVCNFSDPWPKRRHRERRVFRPPFISMIESLLKPEGKLDFKTDVGWYFNLTIAEFRRRAAWEIIEAGRFDRETELEHRREDAHAVTNFERKAREAGSACWAASFRLK